VNGVAENGINERIAIDVIGTKNSVTIKRKKTILLKKDKRKINSLMIKVKTNVK
jgi:hypothetical protein